MSSTPVRLLHPPPDSDEVVWVSQAVASALVAMEAAVYLDHPDGQVECAMLRPDRNAMRPRPRPRVRVAQEVR